MSHPDGLGLGTLALVALGLGLLAAPAPARATWSIVAIDPATREVGAAGASCILGSEVIAVVVPDHGAAVSQAMTNSDARLKLREALTSGEPPAQALGEVTTRWFDSFLGAPTVNLRQYGAVSLAAPDEPASFTGTWTASWGGSESARGVSVQGNTLVGPEVVAGALAAFEGEGRGCRPRLADRLMAALLAGSAAGGDKRCVPELSALSAFLIVAEPDDPLDAPSLHLVRNRPGQPPWSLWQEIRNAMRPVPGSPEENPVGLLRRAYEEHADGSGAPACLPAPRADGASLPD
ncbi:MAG TPA: DUF1028 domain-containing protein [Myxococcota bacterium]|nr:DUF1028 domain-containing protein [Myxococcota bacterium]